MTDRSPSAGLLGPRGRTLLSLLAGTVVAMVLIMTLRSEPEPPPSPGPDRPNVLLIIWDTTRADRMSVYGHERPTTPKLEALAESSRVYENAISPGIWTVPTHASLFTGHPQHSHGANGEWKWLDNRFTTLAERLGEAGYTSVLYTSNVWVGEITNLHQGYDVVASGWDAYHAKRTLRHAAAKLIPTDASTEISPSFEQEFDENLTFARSVHKDGGPVVAESMTRWLDDERDGSQPFFVTLNYMEAHSPRIPSMQARRQVMDPALIEQGLSTNVSQATLIDYTLGDTTFSEDELDAIRGVYDASLAELDHFTGELLFELDERGILDDTLVVITSDHGELLGEHGLFEHRFAVWQPLVHVPLIIRLPGEVEPGRVEHTVSTADVPGTILDLVGVDRAGFPGDNLIDASGGPVVSELTTTEPHLVAQLAALYPDADWDRWLRTWRAVQEHDHKWITASDGTSRLHDLQADPGELDPLNEPTVQKQLEAASEAFDAEHPAYDEEARDPNEGPRGAIRDVILMEQLEMLGYIQGD